MRQGRRICVFAVFLVLALPAAANLPVVEGESGAAIGWSDWLKQTGPAALLVWASWTPQGQTVLDRYEEIAEACKSAGLTLVIVDVQEPIGDGRRILSPKELAWFHDRHGALLQEYRVIRVPSLVILSQAGEVLARLDPTADAVFQWSNS